MRVPRKKMLGRASEAVLPADLSIWSITSKPVAFLITLQPARLRPSSCRRNILLPFSNRPRKVRRPLDADDVFVVVGKSPQKNSLAVRPAACASGLPSRYGTRLRVSSLPASASFSNVERPPTIAATLILEPALMCPPVGRRFLCPLCQMKVPNPDAGRAGRRRPCFLCAALPLLT